jgi:hypothetical protein
VRVPGRCSRRNRPSQGQPTVRGRAVDQAAVEAVNAGSPPRADRGGSSNAPLEAMPNQWELARVGADNGPAHEEGAWGSLDEPYGRRRRRPVCEQQERVEPSLFWELIEDDLVRSPAVTVTNPAVGTRSQQATDRMQVALWTSPRNGSTSRVSRG